MNPIEEIRSWETSDRAQAAALRWFAGQTGAEARAAQILAQADELDATADGWGTIANELELGHA